MVVTRATLTVVGLVALYYTLPLAPRSAADTALLLVGGLSALAVLTAWQVRLIATRARHPGLRALETLALTIPTFLLLFAAGYHLVSQADPAEFSEPLSRTDALYFTVTVFATVGFGDIVPVAEGVRIAVSVQMLADLVLLGVVLRAVLDAVTRARHLRPGPEPAGPMARDTGPSAAPAAPDAAHTRIP
ncbi:potassium channel family protein [Actinomycetospora chlora]|uniref:Potassium channel family protein n=1 Tax=Actinomycetospora chlora TaxID=663608 RepID=A0ABP9AMT6_9PSEU